MEVGAYIIAGRYLSARAAAVNYLSRQSACLQLQAFIFSAAIVYYRKCVLYRRSPRVHLPTMWIVTVSIFDINQPSLPTPFHSVLVSVSVFMALSTVFLFINSLRFLTLFLWS